MEPRFFPRRLFQWFLSKQVSISFFAFFILSAILFAWLEWRVELSQASLQLGREVILISLMAGFLVTCGISLYMARQIVIPLGRLILKTRRLRKFPFAEEQYSEADLSEDEPGEWFDLERALNKLGRDLRQKTIRLSREKTELRAIMSAVNEAILAVDLQQMPLFFNPQFAYLFGVPGTSFIGLSSLVRAPDVLAAYEKALSNGSMVRVDVELTPEHELQARQFQLSVAPLKKKHNQEIYGAVGVFYDITDLKRAERVRIDFVGNVSHELRTPLTSIKGYLQTLIADYRAGRVAEMEEFLNIVNSNVERLKLLVEDLLDLSTLESGQELTFRSIAIRELTESVLQQVNSRDHVVRLHFAADKLLADEGRVQQVLRNLLENAFRYVPKGHKIEIYWEKSHSGRGIQLRVKDDGPGIAPEHQDRLFERFYRVDESRSRDEGGTGIGLALVKHIMLRHHGFVRVQSQVGKGAEFICEFPQYT